MRADFIGLGLKIDYPNRVLYKLLYHQASPVALAPQTYGIAFYRLLPPQANVEASPVCNKSIKWMNGIIRREWQGLWGLNDCFLFHYKVRNFKLLIAEMQKP
tara:strand:+ start:300 stop:605 length:306 start_codon:yes stop_codon:yes gene_type:complete